MSIHFGAILPEIRKCTESPVMKEPFRRRVIFRASSCTQLFGFLLLIFHVVPFGRFAPNSLLDTHWVTNIQTIYGDFTPTPIPDHSGYMVTRDTTDWSLITL